MTERIGIVVGMEDTFPPAFIAKVNETPGFLAEIVKFGALPAEGAEATHRVIVDRLSHEVPFYRFHLKALALAAPSSSTIPSGGAPTRSSSASRSPRSSGWRCRAPC